MGGIPPKFYKNNFLLGDSPPPPSLHVSKCFAASAYHSHNQRLVLIIHLSFGSQKKVNMGCNFITSAHKETSPCDQSWGPRPPCEMPSSTKKSSSWGPNLLHVTSTTKSKLSKFSGHVPASLSVWTVHGTSPHNQMKINRMVLSVCKILQATGVH